jgi:hypothetical protein
MTNLQEFAGMISRNAAGVSAEATAPEHALLAVVQALGRA